MLFAPASEGGEERSREEIAPAYRWDFTLFYPDAAAWEADFEAVMAEAEDLIALRGTMQDGAAQLLTIYQLETKLGIRLGRLFGYAARVRDTDQRDNSAQDRYGRLLAAYARIGPQLAWMDPELLAIPQETVEGWIAEEPALQDYAFNIREMYRLQGHILDEPRETLLSHYSPVSSAPRRIYEALTTADAVAPEVELTDGSIFRVTAGGYSRALQTLPLAEDRRRVQEARMAGFIERRNTFAALYQATVDAGIARTRSRGFADVVHSHLESDNVPVAVLENLVTEARKAQPIFARYHALRQRVLGVETYGWADFFIPLVESTETYPYDAVVEDIIASVAPLGADYQRMMEEQFAPGLIDVYETQGKRSGAYNSGTYGVGSFVLLNHQDTLDSAFTVAHEMGHSLHTRLSQENQPYPTHRYTIFVAEVASIFNEKLYLRHLLGRTEDPRQRLALLEKQIQDIMGTFYLQTIMADYELRAHRMAESGGSLTADRLTEIWQTLMDEYWGEAIRTEDSYRYSWARIPHLFNSPFYVYKYATCYASAASLMKDLEKAPDAASREAMVARYLDLLKAGGSDHPMTQLKNAGVDLSEPTPLAAIVTELDELVTAFAAELETL